MDEGTDAAQRGATRAMSLVRAGSDSEAEVAVLLGFAASRTRPVELARTRCAASVDQDPDDRAAAESIALLDRTRRWGGIAARHGGQY